MSKRRYGMVGKTGRRGARRAATGLVRTIVVGSATLCILLVCFAMYRMSTGEAELITQASQPRLPDVRTEPFPAVPDIDDTQKTGVSVGAGVVGPARDVRLTIYPREGTRASLEIEVRDWMPKPGSANEFVLDRPTVRTRSKDGHAIRVSAERGILEAKRQRGGSVDPRRGRLEGDVLVEYDRLTSAERQARGDAADAPIDPAEILSIETDALEFDFEFAKLAIPGRFTVTAREIDVTGEGLEARFNETAGRMESLRISHGGRIELRGSGELMGLAVPGVDLRESETLTLGAWIRKIVQASPQPKGTAAEAPAEAQETSEKTKTAVVTTTEEGVPVFRSGETSEPGERRAVRYRARFNERVDLRQFEGDTLQAEVAADVLEILRDLGGEQAPAVSRSQRTKRPVAGSGSGSPEPEPVPSTSRIVLTWDGPLAVEAVSDADSGDVSAGASQFRFVGEPARVRSAEGSARCHELTFLPARSEVRVMGDADAPFVLGSADRGVVTGTALTAKQEGDLWHVEVTGPGTVRRAPREATETAGAGSSPPTWLDGTELATSGASGPADIAFADCMSAELREIAKTTVNLSGAVTSRTFRILDNVQFDGGATMRQNDAVLTSRSIGLAFRPQHGWGTVKAVVDRLTAEDDVRLVQKEDRISCGRLDVEMVTDASGQSRPTSATAFGDVEAVQGSRRITASERIRVGLGEAQTAEGESADGARVAVGTGKSVARDIVAVGDVTVRDPDATVDVSADRLHCTLDGTGALETVVVESADAKPASIEHRGLRVAGKEVHLDAVEETADVPGAGRLTFQSYKDLDGSRLKEPIPVTIVWDRSMTYRGKENRAVFADRVHLESETRSATFDCDDRLMVEFTDVVEKTPKQAPPMEGWGLLGEAWAKLAAKAGLSNRRQEETGPLRLWGSQAGSQQRVSKEPAYILATGHAVAVMAERQPETDVLMQRARLAGPKLSVSLREDVSKLLIEGPGNLVLEDFRRPSAAERRSATPASENLFGAAGSGPSKTLIEWENAMWYDFNIDQTRFEGQVELKHFSGVALAKLFGGSSSAMTESGAASEETLRLAPGRSTFMRCDALTVDFFDRAERRKTRDAQRLGTLGAASMRRFEAAGSVTLQDEVEGLALWTDRLVFEQERQILAIYGSSQRQARLVLQSSGRAPRDMRADRMIYNLRTGEVELLRPLATGR